MAPDSFRRREFLQAAVPAAWLAQAGARSVPAANDRINVGFIGLGRRGCANLGHAARVPGLRVAALCDPRPQALERARGSTGAKVHGDAGEMLADVSLDAVCIAVPLDLQPYLAIQACQAGKDVYVEAPVFAKLADGPPMVEAARQYHRVVQAGNGLRSVRPFRSARQIVRSGELGDVSFCRATGPSDPTTPIDLVHFLFDEPAPVSVDAQAGAGPVHITFRYPNFVTSYRGGEAQGGAASWSLAIHGSHATLAVNRDGYSVFPAGLGRPARETETEPSGVAHWKNFLECILTRQRPAADIETCVRSTSACLRARLAMRRDWICG